jgi:hypothetical protein
MNLEWARGILEQNARQLELPVSSSNLEVIASTTMLRISRSTYRLRNSHFPLPAH